MPALNEQENIEDAINDTLRALEDYNIKGEIIVVNDGSTDNTEGIVNNIMKKDNRVRMLKHITPKGIGTSFWDGVDNAKGDVICMLPGDNENDPREIFRYLNLLEDVDIVIPFVFNKGTRPLLRNILSSFFGFIINTTFFIPLNYTNGTALYRKSLLNELDYRRSDFFFQTDILVRLVKCGYLFAEIPYRLRSRKGSKSKAISLRSLREVLRSYLRLVRDIYFRKEKRIKSFSLDSVSAKRYQELGK